MSVNEKRDIKRKPNLIKNNSHHCVDCFLYIVGIWPRYLCKFDWDSPNIKFLTLSLNKNKLEVLPSEQPESSDSVLPANDGYLLDSERVGNFEWWYFDCIDMQNKCMLKIVIHLGTDPLRKRYFPTLALSIKTPEATRAIEYRYNLKDFHADKNRCDVRLREDCHIYSESDNPGNYHIDINISEFRASLMFKQTVPGWIPPAHKMKVSKGNRHSEFYWNVLQPRSIVNGSFEYNNISYTLNDAIGYHDHNYWQLNSKQGLYMDEVITKWYWGKCVAGPYTVIFMETWMGGVKVKSIMVSEYDKIVYGTDKNLTITVNKEILHAPLKSKYPSQITMQIKNEDFPLELVLKCEELIDSKDLLRGMNPLIAWLVKSLVARPAYYGIKSTALLETQNQKLVGFGNYELMFFRKP